MAARMAAAAVALCLGTTAARGEDAVGTVAALVGTADVVHPGVASGMALHAGDAIQLGDRIHTGDGSKARLLFRDDSVLTLAANSELTVDREVVGPDTASATHAVVGTLRAVVTDRYRTPGSSFEVETPTAIAGVRGTAFFVQYDPATKRARIVDLHGIVCVRPRPPRPAREEVCLAARQETRVEGAGAPGRPTPVDAGVLQDLLAATEILSGGLDPEEELGPSHGQAPAAAAEPGRPAAPAFPNEDAVVDQPIPQLRNRGGQTPSGTPPPPPPPPPPGVRTR